MTLRSGVVYYVVLLWLVVCTKYNYKKVINHPTMSEGGVRSAGSCGNSSLGKSELYVNVK